MRTRAHLPGPLVLSVLVLVVGGASQAHAAVSFAPPISYPVGSGPRSIAAGDFNGDHDLDLAVANEFSDGVSVLLGGPGGNFGAQTSYPVVGHPLDVAVGDFNGDGDPDLAVAANGVSILLGGPGGTFGAPTSYQVFRARAVAVGDFNGDLDPDLAVTNLEPNNSITVLRGEAGGTFTVVQTTYPVGGRNPVSVALDDFNEDDLLDVVTANVFSDNISVLLGAGGGGFGAPVTYQAGERSDEVVVGDFNGDGDPDLATANDGAHNTSVRLGRPGAGFTKQAKYLVSPPPASVAVGDFDLDDHLDLAFHSLGISVLRGVGDGTFGAQTSFAGGGIALTVGDFNEDGHPDLAGAIYSGATVSVVLNAWVGLDPSSILWAPRPDRTESELRTATLENHTGRDLAVGEVALAGPDASSFRLPSSYDECTGTTVPDGESCTVKVRFRPIGVGPKSATLVFSHDGPGSPQTVTLSGTGTPGPWLERSVQALDFGSTPVGSATLAKTVMLTNVGSAPLTINGIAKDGANPTDFRNLTQNCTAVGTLDPGESCDASIAFRPTATGLRTANLTITDTAPRNPHHVGLSGRGT
jgi:FG-GAP-like repeat